MTHSNGHNGGITLIPGIKVGHYTDAENATGCTVVLSEAGVMGGVDVRGGAPGTHETDLLRPEMHMNQVHGIVLSGGSAFGLESANGVMQYLEEHGIGYQAVGVRVPIVPAAILFDLAIGSKTVRPDKQAGYKACEAASNEPPEEGSVGAGTGATVAKLAGRDHIVKGGIGTYALDLGGGLLVGALVAVNALGAVYDPDTGELVAGPRGISIKDPDDPFGLLSSPKPLPKPNPIENTTIGVVATNARLDKATVNKLASSAHDGLAMSVRPAHTPHDGDTFFALATGDHEPRVHLDRVLAAAALCVACATVRAVQQAKGLAGVPSISEVK
ncbi:MAG: P1 family peptidase [Chloroflexi bacterium]|nr:P1 family peptidase [Chloroflexota bacterium]